MKKIVKRVLLAGALLVLILFVAALVIFYSENVKEFAHKNPGKTAFMDYFLKQARAGNPGARISYRYIPLARISNHLVNAILIAEDDRFFRHSGLDWIEIREVFQKALQLGRFSRGASTITQQLVKNLYLSPSRDPLRKLREVVLAFKAEMFLKKKRILELYLNVAQFGKLIFGVEAASRYYFKKSAADLNAEESIRLAAILPNPMRYKVFNENSRLIYRRRLLITVAMRVRHLTSRFEHPLLLQTFKAEYRGK